MAKKNINPWLDDGRFKRMVNQHNYGTPIDSSFKGTINTNLGTGTTFTLPLPSGQTYDFWWTPYDGATPLHVTAYNDANATYDYGIHGTYQFSVGVNYGDVCGGWSFNDGGDKLKITTIDQWGNIGFEYLERAFWGCTNLISIYASDAILKGNLFGFVYNCISLETLDLLNADTSGVTQLSSFARGCSSLVNFDPSNWNLSNCLTIFAFMFGCVSYSSSIDTSNWNCSPTSVTYAFYNCINLQSLNVSGISLVNVPSLSNFAYNCQNLVSCDTSSWDVSNLTNVINAWYHNYALTSSFDASKFWNNPNITSYSNCFTGDTLISNYESIPNGWKGL